MVTPLNPQLGKLPQADGSHAARQRRSEAFHALHLTGFVRELDCATTPPELHVTDLLMGMVNDPRDSFHLAWLVAEDRRADWPTDSQQPILVLAPDRRILGSYHPVWGFRTIVNPPTVPGAVPPVDDSPAARQVRSDWFEALRVMGIFKHLDCLPAAAELHVVETWLQVAPVRDALLVLAWHLVRDRRSQEQPIHVHSAGDGRLLGVYNPETGFQPARNSTFTLPEEI